ncbi:MAG: carboxypeptidase regulatory-like domain-containing protein [Rhizobiaceae bacterium]|nr:MAG: carboxypeptidase regulatory-like domain-containing protein [Rhizobiaceae bacterium]CAG0996431.1 hypothetical protein RHIZO_02543 [Rhizobiaceae bacterium]
MTDGVPSRGYRAAAVAARILLPRMAVPARPVVVVSFFTATLAVGVARADADGAPMETGDTTALWKFSCYGFRDVDRSGVFDMGDRAFADLAVVLTKDGGEETVQFSNIDGFANFSTATGGGAGIDVARPGPYPLRADPPQGFVATAGAKQTLVFRADAVVPGGLAIEESCAPVGVAPDLAVSGSVIPLPGGNVADVTLTIAGATGATETTALDAQGRFAFPARPGTFKLIAEHGPSGATQVRHVAVARHAVRLSAIDFAAPTPEAGTSVDRIERIIGFDDLVGAGGIFEVPTGYGGLSWRNLIAVHNRFYDGPGYVNGTESGEFVAYNSSGAPASVWRDRPFDFGGAHVAVAWPRGAEGDVIVRAWRGNDQVHHDRLAVSSAGGTFFAADYRGVTRIEFSHELHERIVLDDLRIAE